MSLLNEYISKRMGGNELEAELQGLISRYNKLRGTYLFVYAAAIGKPIPSVPIEQADFYVIHDLLSDKKSLNKVDIYLETPGGSGETAEEIVEFLRNNFDTVSFVVSGEAKSAGTIIVLSGDEILMTETGSLGPIDAQMKIGRSVISAYDYIEWVEEKRKRAEEIAKELTNHSKWRSHGRSIKIDDLEEIGLKITRVDINPKLAEIVYRIQTVCRLLFDTTTSFKIFATQDNKIFRQAVPVGAPIRIPEKPTVDIAEIEQKCPKCGETYKIYAKFVPNPKIDVDFKNKGFIPFPKDAKITCNCGFEIDLLGIKNQIEIQTGRKII